MNRDATHAEASFEEAKKLAMQLHDYAMNCAYSSGESPDCEDAHGDLERANNKTEATLSINLTNQLLALTHYGLAQTFSKQNPVDLAKVKQEYRESLQSSPDFFRAHYQLGRIYISENNYKNAQNELQKTIQLEPGFEQAYTDWRALIDQWKKLPGKQKSDKPLNRTLARDYKIWGDAFSRAGDPDDATERYCNAAHLDSAYQALCMGQTGKASAQP